MIPPRDPSRIQAGKDSWIEVGGGGRDPTPKIKQIYDKLNGILRKYQETIRRRALICRSDVIVSVPSRALKIHNLLTGSIAGGVIDR